MSLLVIILVLASVGYFLARRQALHLADGRLSSLHSRPGYYAWFAFLSAALPALAIVLIWSALEHSVLQAIVVNSLPADVRQQSPDAFIFFMDDVVRYSEGRIVRGEQTAGLEAAGNYWGTLQTGSTIAKFLVVLLLLLFMIRWSINHVSAKFRARNVVERIVTYALWSAAVISILTTAGIVFAVLFESLRFFDRVPISEFLFGLQWSPQTAIRADQIGSSGAFGAVPLFAGTLLITVIAMSVAGPIGMFSAIYLAEYASPRFRDTVKPIMEILAGIPTVVYGFFAALTVAPFIRRTGEAIGLSVSSESALAAGIVMGIMIIPFVSSLADDALSAVPSSLREGSLALGATRAETVAQVIVPAALPGIIAGFLLAVSRAIGETMIVVMAAGLAANLTANPLQAVTTVTVQIVTLLVGDQEFESAKTLAAFALGLVLFVVTLVLNIVALHVMQTYREKYD